MHQVSLTIDGSGGITQVLVDSVDQSLTGTLTKLGTSHFRFVLSDLTEGGLIADAAGSHAALLDEVGNFGALQKGATALPVYNAADVVGAWSGYSVMLTGFAAIQAFSSAVTVANDATRTYSGSDTVNGALAGSLPNVARVASGIWEGTFTSPNPGGPVKVFLSPDKTLAASWACAAGGVIPGDCSFSAWNK